MAVIKSRQKKPRAKAAVIPLLVTYRHFADQLMLRCDKPRKALAIRSSLASEIRSLLWKKPSPEGRLHGLQEAVPHKSSSGERLLMDAENKATSFMCSPHFNGLVDGKSAYMPKETPNTSLSLMVRPFDRAQQNPAEGLNQRFPKATPLSLSLQALTAAALALPGLVLTPAYAADEEFGFQYGHYQEGNRNLFGNKSKFAPIEVDSIQGSAKIKLSDRVKFAFNYVQDTWGGATPIATAPEVFGGNGSYGAVRVRGQVFDKTGATPFILNSTVALDKQLNPLSRNGVKNTQLVHTLSEASPETRKQGDFKLGYEWDEAALDIGGGTSVEPDYESRFGSLGGRWDLNQKQTSLNLGLSYTASDTNAKLDHDATPYIPQENDELQRSPYNNTHTNSEIVFDSKTASARLLGQRKDWATYFGLTQVLNKNALIETGVGYTRSTGYMDNPYKVVEVAFIDPNDQLCNGKPADGYCAKVNPLLEERPDVRNQWTGNLRYVQHIDALDAALHFDYRIFSDDWGITSHTFETDWAQPLGNGWTITPRVRYYSQDAASFYTPYLVTRQGITSNAVDPVKGQIYIDTINPSNGQVYFDDSAFVYSPDGDVIGINPSTGNAVLDANGNPLSQAAVDNLSLTEKKVPFDRNKLPANYSSDHRLSGYGALSGGITVSKRFAKGVSLEAGIEYYSHAGSLKIGGGGEGDYSNFNYYVANAALKVDLSALGSGGGGGDDDHSGHEHRHHHGAPIPAGVMFGHMMDKSGDIMVGYRYMYGTQAGSMLHGSDPVADQTIVSQGCGTAVIDQCFVTPNNMNMHMHMLDIMYAPTDWLNLMLMPQFVDMNMTMRRLDGAPADAAAGDKSKHIPHHLGSGHNTGGVGDTGMYALFKLLGTPNNHINMTLGVTAPTGDVAILLRKNHTIEGGFIHYGMQLGSGTWDFKPALTYTGQFDQWSWGAQVNGTKRLQNKNSSGFAFGDIFQSTAWGSYNLLDWLSASVRGVYTVQGTVRHEFNGLINALGPMDYPKNYGGRYWDVGFGVNASVMSGDLAGNNLSFEWLQPVGTDVNGYQLDRNGALSATWSYAF